MLAAPSRLSGPKPRHDGTIKARPNQSVVGGRRSFPAPPDSLLSMLF
jgi:hypothetical protein